MGRPKLDTETADYIYTNPKGDKVAVWYNDRYYVGKYGFIDLRTTKNLRTGRIQYYYTVCFYFEGNRQTMSAKIARNWCDNGKEKKNG